MNVIECNLLNSSQNGALLLVFKEYTNEYTAEYSAEHIMSRVWNTDTTNAYSKERM